MTLESTQAVAGGLARERGGPLVIARAPAETRAIVNYVTDPVGATLTHTAMIGSAGLGTLPKTLIAAATDGRIPGQGCVEWNGSTVQANASASVYHQAMGAGGPLVGSGCPLADAPWWLMRASVKLLQALPAGGMLLLAMRQEDAQDNFTAAPSAVLGLKGEGLVQMTDPPVGVWLDFMGWVQSAALASLVGHVRMNVQNLANAANIRFRTSRFQLCPVAARGDQVPFFVPDGSGAADWLGAPHQSWSRRHAAHNRGGWITDTDGRLLVA